MGVDRVRLAGLIPVGFQVMSLDNSTAVAINSTLRAGPATILDVSVEDVAARYRADATAPTNTTGVLLPVSSLSRFDGYNNTSNFKIVRSGTSGTSKVSIFAYKMPGDV